MNPNVPSEPAPRDIDPELQRIIQRAAPGARILRARPMGADDASRNGSVTAKSAGYGVPIRIDVEVHDRKRSFVLHGSSANQFGHDRRADRAAELLLARDTFGNIPRHTQALDVGAFRQDGSSVSLLDSGEFYLLTEFAPGTPYAEDLRRIARTHVVEPGDVRRVATLVGYLAELHAERHDGVTVYRRSVRDVLGSGEGIFGIADAYPSETPGADARRLQQLEMRCLEFRWKLKRHESRLARIHGDFHPFNVLFDEQSVLHLLDTSRGSLGDPADDVSCMAVNYVFFALEEPASWQAAFARLWYQLWDEYLARSGDAELLSVVAPFLTWRLLVLACPVWYPNLTASARERLLALADAALAAERFDPRLAEAVFR
jgi:hypothetical protein